MRSALTLFLLSIAPGLAPAAPLEPLPEAAAKAFAALRPDPPPPEIVRNSHYWVSNEYRHDLFLPHLKDLGGVFLGVGTDQNYLMAGWSKPEVLVLMDFDAAIPRIHRAYTLAFAAAETPADFMAFWADDNAAAVLETLRAKWGEDEEGKRTVKAFKVARPIVLRRLKLTQRRYRKRGVATFLDDAAQYAYVRDLSRSGRVFAVRGDLTADRTMLDIGAATRAAGMVIRTVYMSNAPQYFDFKEQFRANIAALPFDERSIFVHTLTRGAFGYADGYYHYNVQPGLNFQAWMARGRYRKLTQILRHRRKSEIEGFSTMEALPEDVPGGKALKPSLRKE